MKALSVCIFTLAAGAFLLSGEAAAQGPLQVEILPQIGASVPSERLGEMTLRPGGRSVTVTRSLQLAPATSLAVRVGRADSPWKAQLSMLATRSSDAWVDPGCAGPNCTARDSGWRAQSSTRSAAAGVAYSARAKDSESRGLINVGVGLKSHRLAWDGTDWPGMAGSGQGTHFAVHAGAGWEATWRRLETRISLDEYMGWISAPDKGVAHDIMLGLGLRFTL